MVTITRPWALYNEIDEYAAEWIENLIHLGEIAPGIVDRRSIVDICPDELRGFRQCHFFAGIAVWSYALRRAGVSDDTALWTGSAPCQPFSAAGAGGGVDDERHLWPHWFHLIGSARPPRVYGEQVASKDGLGWLDLVSSDLEGAGYSIWAVDTCSAGSGAPHIRQRLRFCADDLRSSANRMDDRLGSRLEGQWNGHHSEAGQRKGSLRPVATAGGVEWVVNPDGGHPGAEWEQRGGEQRQQPQDGGSGDRTAPARPGPTNGVWGNADWLFCRDAKWRPVVASHVEMVDGSAANLGRGGTHCQEESQTRLQAMLDTFGEEEIQRQAGRQWALREEGLLRPILHGRLDGRPDQEPDAAEQPQTICEDCGSNVRGVSGHGNLVPCASCGREPAEQRPLELEDVVRQLSQSLSLAELYGRWESARRLRLLQRAINEEGSLLRPPVAGEAAWASLGEDAKGRIRLGFDVGAWRQVVSFPLVSGCDFKPGSGSPFEGKSRQGMLKGYGNAIDAEATIDFIEATLEPDAIEITVGADTRAGDFEDLLG